MFDLKVISTLSEVEKKSGVKLLPLLSAVPFGNVVTAFKTIPIPDLVDMVMGVPPTKLVEGLSIISAGEIERVPVGKLKVVLFDGDMSTVRKLQETLKEDFIVKALTELPSEEISSLLKRDDFLEISDRILEVNGVVG